MATLEAEVISAICKNRDIHLVLGDDPELFGGYGDVFAFMKEYYLKHKQVPSAELISDRFSNIDLVQVDGPSAYYVDELRSSYVSAQIRSLLIKADDALGKHAAAKVLEKLTTDLASLGRYTSSVRDLNLTDAENAAEHFKSLREIGEANGGISGISTGFKAIDANYPTGFAGGHSIVLMGYTGRAKSMWSALVARQAWKQGKKVMIVSLEMTPEEYREREYAMMSEGLFHISDLARGQVSEDDFRTWSKKNLEGSADFIVVSNQGQAEVTPNVIQSKIDTHKPDLVILDYLQLMSDNAKTVAMTPRMMSLSREIKLLAVNNNIPIISITAVTDEDGDKRDAPPVLSQVAWSKAIEYDANLVIAVHRHDNDDIVEVVARKNRHGDLFDFGFQVDFNAGVWTERYDIF